MIKDVHRKDYEMINDKEVVLATVTKDADALDYASEELQNHYKEVLQYDGIMALECATEQLQKD